MNEARKKNEFKPVFFLLLFAGFGVFSLMGVSFHNHNSELADNIAFITIFISFLFRCLPRQFDSDIIKVLRILGDLCTITFIPAAVISFISVPEWSAIVLVSSLIAGVSCIYKESFSGN